jgi:hypothetical protein
LKSQLRVNINHLANLAENIVFAIAEIAASFAIVLDCCRKASLGTDALATKDNRF